MKNKVPSPVKLVRKYLPVDLTIETWEDLLPFVSELAEREIDSLPSLKQYLSDVSEFEAVVEEDMAWRYISMTIDTTDESAKDRFTYFVREIQPKLAPYDDKIKKKISGSPFISQLDPKDHSVYLRCLKNALELYREENIPLLSQIAELSQKYGAIAGAMTIEHEGQILTLQQAGVLLKENDRDLRETIYRKIQERRLVDRDQLDELFTQLVRLRHQVALNAGFENFRDYKFAELCRFDYGYEDCLNFHSSIETEILPLANELLKNRKEKLGYSSLKPWDLQVDPFGRPPLKAFSSEEELVNKGIRIFEEIDPEFGNCLSLMHQMGHLNLSSKNGKAPGGYNYPLFESGVPFIFMNAVGSPRDLVTFMHEGGHAIHSIFTAPLQLTSFKSFPSEVAELASMGMELFTMDKWEHFYSDKTAFNRAREEHLEDILIMLPWIAIVDSFQHWIYTHPDHTTEQRSDAWMQILAKYGDGVTDYSGLEEYCKILWQKQLHIFEVPFYYIEYGMAQLGAIAMWRNFKEDNKKALKNYKNALRIGYTRPISEIYSTAGIRFDFSRDYIKELASFVKEELASLKELQL